MKLIIQIPCYNEEESLPQTLSDLPREIPGIDVVEWLVINDGSVDHTEETARANGVDHIVNFTHNRGLARAFTAGLEECIKQGADIIVNTDADNQYCADDIPKLVEPILRKRAEIVVGARDIAHIKHFSLTKKLLQKFGSMVVRIVSKTEIHDAPSGFRAFSRDAAIQLNVFNDYTYTLETIIQAGQKGMAITSVPVRINGETRPSRLIRSVPSYLKQSIVTILRIFITYQPFKFFSYCGLFTFFAGFLVELRFLYYFYFGEGSGKIQSVILSALLMGSGLLLYMVALLSDLISVNRQLLENIRARQQALEDQIKEDKRGNDG